MTLLSRYLIRRNLFLMLVLLLVGCGIYVLTDLFERLDNFMDARIGFWVGVRFFLVKLPLIVSQILPAVLLLATAIQLNMLERGRELMALYAGGISPLALARFILCYGIIWALAQIMFAQILGVAGEQEASRIWREDVQGNARDSATIKGLWLTQDNLILHVGKATPARKSGENLLVYRVDASGLGIEEIIKADTFTIKEDRWIMEKGERLVPVSYTQTPFDVRELLIRQDLSVFETLVNKRSGAGELSLWALGKAIERLELSGSNVEVLRTAWHGKLAYAGSLVVMAALALVISQLTANVYKSVGACLLIVFLYHSLNNFGAKLGEQGVIIPAAAAWLANAVFLSLCLLWGLRSFFQRLIPGRRGARC